MRSLYLVVVLASLALAGEARAHLDLLYPTPRTTSLKSGPCGAGPDDPRGPTVATFKPGEKITVTWNEYVNHPGHYRIAIDMDGQDGFFDPKSFDDVSGGPGVIMDGIPDKQGGDYAQEITLPNEECDNCVLQVIQMMTDKPPYGDGNDLYYQCADIAIVGEGGGTTGEPGTTTGEPGSTGGSVTSNDPSSTSDPSAGDAGSGGATDATGAAETADTGPQATGGDEPTTGAVDPGTGSGTDGAGTGGSTGAASDGGATDGGDKDSGCGCRGDAGAPGLLLLGLAPLLLRRGRRG